jgi:hypothetical protein
LLPALCRKCGASAQFVHNELHCGYCGMREVLPREQGALVGELQQRLFFAANASFQATGTLRTLAGMFERGTRVGTVAWTFFALGVAVTVSVVLDSLPMWQAAPVVLRAGLITSALLTPALVLAVPVSLVVARAVGRMRYRRVVRPHLLARPPKLGGTAARCRVCGGDLPPALDPIVACKYCRSESVVGRELFAQNAAFVRQNELAELGRARALAPAAQNIASWMKFAMGLSFTGSLVTAAGFLWLLYRALGATVR